MFGPKMKIKKIHFWILTADLLWMFGALVLGICARYAGGEGSLHLGEQLRAYSEMIFAAATVWVFLYFRLALDGFKGGWRIFAMLSQITVAVSFMMIALLAFSFLAQHYYSRLVLLCFAAFFFLGLVGLRCAARFLVTSKMRNTANDRCVILGHGPVARELAAKIAVHPELPFQIEGFLFPAESEASNGFTSSLETHPVSSVKTLQVLDLLIQQNVQNLIIAMPDFHGAEIRKLISGCRLASIQVHLIPQWYDLYLSKAELMEIDGLPLISLRELNPLATRFGLKRTIDFVLGLGILISVLPVLFAAAIVVSSRKGKPFRTELRCGKDGKIFRMLRLNVNRHSLSQYGYEKLLIRWSVTELPQLWNVVIGDMSLVGPRPEPPEKVKYYSDWQRQRLKVPAGITGLAQVHGLRDQHSSEEKAHFDLQYIFDWHPLLDLSLMLQTVWTLLFRGLNQEPSVSQIADTARPPRDFAGTESANANRS
jgi:lipopolysaccharide/colanic/teichoic acid biosynthesis glycosyltransferase